MIWVAFPLMVWPQNGVFRPWLSQLFSLTVHVSSGLKIQMSAALPVVKLPCFRARILAGFCVTQEIPWLNDKAFVSMSLRINGKSVSRAEIPGCVEGNAPSLASASCGWCAEQTASITPHFNPSIKACLSVSVRKGGRTWSVLSKVLSSFSVKNNWWMATSAETGNCFCLAACSKLTDSLQLSWEKWIRQRVSSHKARLCCIAMISEAFGIPGRPNRDAAIPSWTQPWSCSQCNRPCVKLPWRWAWCLPVLALTHQSVRRLLRWHVLLCPV